MATVKLPADATHWTTSNSIKNPVSATLTYPYGASSRDSPHHGHTGGTSPRVGATGGSARLWRTTSPHSAPGPQQKDSRQASRMRSLLAKKRRKRSKQERARQRAAAVMLAGDPAAPHWAVADVRRGDGEPGLPPYAQGPRHGRSTSLTHASSSPQLLPSASNPALRGRPGMLPPKPAFQEGGMAAAFYEDLEQVAAGAAQGARSARERVLNPVSARRGVGSQRRPRISQESAAALGLVEFNGVRMNAIRPNSDTAASVAALRRRLPVSPLPAGGGVVGTAAAEALRMSPPRTRPTSPLLHAMPEFVQGMESPPRDGAPGSGSGQRRGPSTSPLARMLAAERAKIDSVEQDTFESRETQLKREESLRRIQSLGELSALMAAEEEEEEAEAANSGLVRVPRATAQNPAILKQVQDTLLAEWLEGYHEEQASFTSAAIASEVKLRRAEVFTQHMPQPNPLLTAVAFEVMDMVGGLFGRYNGLMRRVRDIIFQSVYTDDLGDVRERATERRIMNPRPRPLSARAGRMGGGGTRREELPDTDEFDKLGVEEYYECTPYYSLSVALKEEQKRLEKKAEELNRSIAEQERKHKSETQQTKKKMGMLSMWKGAAKDTRAQRKVQGLQKEIKKAGDTVAHLAQRNLALEVAHDNTVETIRKFFAQLDGDVKKETLKALLDENQQSWQGVMKHMMKSVSHHALTDMVVRTMQAKPDYSAGDMVKLVTNIVHRQKHGGGIQRKAGYQSITGVEPGSTVDTILQMMGQLTQEELASLLKELFATMSPQQRQEHFSHVIAGVQAGAQNDVKNGVTGAASGSTTITQLMQTLVTASTNADAAGGAGAGAGAGAGGVGGAGAAGAMLTNLLTAGLDTQKRPGTGGSASSQVVHPAGAAIVQLLKSDAFKQALATLDPETRAELLKYLQGVHRETLQSEVEAAAARAAEGGVLSDDDVVLLERYNPGALEAARAAAGGAGAGAGADGEGDGKGEGGDGGADAGTSTSEDFVDKDNPAPFGFAHRRVQCQLGGGSLSGLNDEALSSERSSASARTRRIIKQELPWSRYLKAPKRRSKKIPKLKLATALLLMYDCFEKKIVADATSDRVQALAGAESGSIPARQPFGTFISEHLFHKFGLASLRDNYLYGMVACIGSHVNKSSRVRLFGTLCGVVDPSRYSSRLCDIYLALVKGVFPKFTGNTFRSRKEGTAWVKFAHVVKVVASIFVDEPVTISLDTVQLSDGRRTKLYETLQGLAKPYIEVEELLAGGKQEEEDAASTSTKTHKGIPPSTLMVDFDEVAWACLAVWHEQMEADKATLTKLYIEYDQDGNGVLSYDEFHKLIITCVRPDEDLSAKQVLRLFQMIRKLDGKESSDVVSPEAFALMCPTHGVTPNHPPGSGTTPGVAGFPNYGVKGGRSPAGHRITRHSSRLRADSSWSEASDRSDAPSPTPGTDGGGRSSLMKRLGSGMPTSFADGGDE